MYYPDSNVLSRPSLTLPASDSSPVVPLISSLLPCLAARPALPHSRSSYGAAGLLLLLGHAREIIPERPLALVPARNGFVAARCRAFNEPVETLLRALGSGLRRLGYLAGRNSCLRREV